VIALGPASFNSSYRCEVVSIVVDRGELAVWIVVDSLTNTILDSLDFPKLQLPVLSSLSFFA
jgi:hypothetical protein